ncbi:hypothetical protein JCM8547_003241 [Rhodosporidiobolus lusitaniae]
MSTPLVAPSKPKNARSKRAAVARESVLVEKAAKTALIVRTAGISDKVKTALSEINQLKKPHSITFSKSNNTVRPFEDTASLNFWSSKNDASLFVVGTHTKKRPHGLVWVRCFAGEVMEMLEVGIEEVMAMSHFKSIKSTVGGLPLFHFSAIEPHTSLWDTHPTFVQFKSLMLDFFRGTEMDGVSLKGLERVISVTIGGSSAAEEAVRASAEGAANGSGKGKAVDSLIGGLQVPQTGDFDEDKSLPVVHFRTYTVKFMRSGLPQPRVELEPHGPHFTFSLRRSQQPASEVWKAAMKKSEKKAAKKEGEVRNKNVDIDEMGNRIGIVHVDSQDLGKLQSRKFKGLKRRPGEEEDVAQAAENGEAAEGVVGGTEKGSAGGRQKKRRTSAAADEQ